jgi:hypothetical protein
VPQEKLDNLIAKREAMNARIRQEQGRERSRQRREETRRKIIAGAIALNEEDPAIRAWLYRTLGKVLVRKDERDLFALPPLPAERPAPAAEGPMTGTRSDALPLGMGGRDEEAARMAH